MLQRGQEVALAFADHSWRRVLLRLSECHRVAVQEATASQLGVQSSHHRRPIFVCRSLATGSHLKAVVTSQIPAGQEHATRARQQRVAVAREHEVSDLLALQNSDLSQKNKARTWARDLLTICKTSKVTCLTS
eukprot:SAG31_NODE_498_length_14861_cov_3.405026_15_plen_133_part_00